MALDTNVKVPRDDKMFRSARNALAQTLLTERDKKVRV